MFGVSLWPQARGRGKETNSWLKYIRPHPSSRAGTILCLGNNVCQVIMLTKDISNNPFTHALASALRPLQMTPDCTETWLPAARHAPNREQAQAPVCKSNRLSDKHGLKENAVLTCIRVTTLSLSPKPFSHLLFVPQENFEMRLGNLLQTKKRGNRDYSNKRTVFRSRPRDQHCSYWDSGAPGGRGKSSLPEPAHISGVTEAVHSRAERFQQWSC